MTRPGAVLDVMEIFNDALDQPSRSARGAYLDRACGVTWRLRARVETLLAAHDRAEGFLESPAAGGDDRRRPARAYRRPWHGHRPLQAAGADRRGRHGRRLRGRADEPVRRKVALKIIKPGMDTKQVIARFEAERQALAMMDHPNIAKVHDAGATGVRPAVLRHGAGPRHSRSPTTATASSSRSAIGWSCSSWSAGPCSTPTRRGSSIAT